MYVKGDGYVRRASLAHDSVAHTRLRVRIGNVACRLDLPPELEPVHLVSRTSMLRKYSSDLALVVPSDNIGVTKTLTYDKVPVQTLDRQIRQLRNDEVAPVKVP